MSVSYLKIVMETGFVNSAELRQFRSMKQSSLTPATLRKNKAEHFFFHSLQITQFPRAGLFTVTGLTTGQSGRLIRRAHMVPFSDSHNSSPSEEQEFNGHRYTAIRLQGVTP